MKQTTFIVLLIFFFGLTQNLCAQSDKQLSQDEITKRRLEYKMSHAKRTMDAPEELGVQGNKYDHREKEILAKLNTDVIPADFPVYQPAYSKAQYTAKMEEWYAANPSLLRKEKETNTNQQK